MNSPQICPGCGAANDDTTLVGDGERSPSENDISVCLYCGQIGIFTGLGVTLRMPTEQEMDSIKQDPELLRALAVTHLYRRNKMSKLN